MPDKKKAIGKLKKDNISKSPKGTNYLLTIGIDDYEHCPKLNNAVKDTRDIANVLFEKYNFEEKNHLKLENKEATLDNIIALFRKIKTKATAKDNVLIYYSGHGKLNEDEESFWIPVDARENKEGDFISVDKLFRLIKVIKSHHILLILDSCFSGSMLSANTSRSLNKNETQPSRYGIASGRRELVSDGKPGANSPFADSLIKKLKINSESLGASDLAQQVMHLTKDATNQNQVPLHGRMRITGDKLGEFFFHPKEENKEVSLWESVVMENTIHAYDDYLEKFPNGKYADEAEQRMEEIGEEEMWNKTKRNNSLVSYRKYLRKYSIGKYQEEAQSAIHRLKLKNEEVMETGEEIIQNEPEVIERTPHITKDSDLFIDSGDGQTYKTVKLKDGNVWMAEDFNFYIGKGHPYSRELYTWDIAQKICPEGWRLPSEKEWSTMINLYAGKNNNLGLAYDVLLEGGNSKLDLLLSCSEYNEVNRERKYGEYWTATEEGKNVAWCYRFDNEKRTIFKKNDNKNHLCSCRYIKISDEEKSVKKKKSKIIQPTPHIIKDPNLFTDHRDGQTYKTIKLKDGNIWMAQNLRFDVGEGSVITIDSLFSESGGFYTWESALKACPDGWHIPNYNEWTKMIVCYGGNYLKNQVITNGLSQAANRKAAYFDLVKGGNSKFEATLEGVKSSEGGYDYSGRIGNYWSGSEHNEYQAWYYSFQILSKEMFAYNGNKTNLFSSRCVKN